MIYEVAQNIVKNNLTVRDVERLAKTSEKPHRLQKERAKDVTAFMTRLSLRLRRFSAERLRYITAERNS